MRGTDAPGCWMLSVIGSFHAQETSCHRNLHHRRALGGAYAIRLREERSSRHLGHRARPPTGGGGRTRSGPDVEACRCGDRMGEGGGTVPGDRAVSRRGESHPGLSGGSVQRRVRLCHGLRDDRSPPRLHTRAAVTGGGGAFLQGPVDGARHRARSRGGRRVQERRRGAHAPGHVRGTPAADS